MLKKAHISRIRPPSEEWYIARLAKFTSSEIHYLTYPTGFTEGSLSYIRRKVGEELTGKPARDEITTPAMMHGLLHEADSIRKFAVKMGCQLDFTGGRIDRSIMIVQHLVTDPDTRYGSTPDGLIVLRESPDETQYEVETVESKSPPSYDGYISLFECESPLDLKKVKREYYWQVLDQMDTCGARRGHFIIYHPDFKAGNHKSITFVVNELYPVTKDNPHKFPIFEDLKLLRQRKLEAVQKFEEIRAKLTQVLSI